MADIVVTASKVAPIDQDQAQIYPMVPAVAINRGQAVYLNSAGKAALGIATAAGTVKTGGIALETAGVRQGVSILKRGKVGGFAVSALAYGALIYSSDTPGAVADATGTSTQIVGKVVPMSDSDLTKVIYFDFPWLT
ncbi:MAG: hypothetical protein JWN86_3613 [Planctomycetota bacterium]|nr:hypothetical protein [Planctomycetota bacterium]